MNAGALISRFVHSKVRQGNYNAGLRRLWWLGWMLPRVHAAHQRGLILSLGGREAEAVTQYREAIDLVRGGIKYPIVRLYSSLGHALTGLGRYDEAAGWLQQAIRAGDATGNAQDGMAQLYLRSGDRPDEALQYVEQAIEVAGKRRGGNVAPVYYADRAWALALLGRTDEARQSLGLARPKPADTIAGRASLEWVCGKVLLAIGNLTEARGRFEAGVRIDPQGKYGRLCRQDLDVC